MPKRLLLLDPYGELTSLAEALADAAAPDAAVTVTTRREILLARLSEHDVAVIDDDLGDGEYSGRQVLAAIRRVDDEIPVIMVAGKGSVQRAADAVAAGATDFLVRGSRLPDRVHTLLAKLRRVLRLIDEKRQLTRDNQLLRAQFSLRYSIVGRTPEIERVIDIVERVAKVPRPVLIEGERGSGKELVARAIHAASGVTGPFIAVNCAAFADALLDSELFGHERGAFTGAHERHAGKLELAHRGTLFLDEIGNMSLSFQQKILRAIEYGSFLRVGGTEEVKVNARVLAATNAQLQNKMAQGEFLRDLYDRLAFEVIVVPPLRERRDDIAPLAQHFMRSFIKEVPEFAGKRLAPETLEVLYAHDFPGNIRELKNLIERAVYRDTTDIITPQDIGLLASAFPATTTPTGSFKERIEALERQLVSTALRNAGGNQAQAARELGLSYHQLRYYRSKHGLDAEV